MLKRLLVAVLVLLLLGVMPIGAQVPDYEGELASASAVLMDAATGRVLFEKDPHIQLAPASITKIMTILLTVEAIKRGDLALDDVLVTSDRAKNMGGTQLFLETGEEISVENALIGMAVESANDAAVVVAERIGGSVEGFVELMNRRAAELGMNNTNFVNPTGLPEEDGVQGTLTTAYDVALMSRELLKYPEVNQWATIPWDTQFLGRVYIANKNLKFLRTYPGADGLKTGWTGEAGFCLSATALRAETRMIAVVMKAPTYDMRMQDAINLLNYGFGHYRSQLLYHQGEVLGVLPVEKGVASSVQVLAREDVAVLLEKAGDQGVETIVLLPSHVNAPLAQGDALGSIQLVQDDEVLHSVDLVAASSIAKANWFQLIGKMMRNLLETIR